MSHLSWEEFELMSPFAVQTHLSIETEKSDDFVGYHFFTVWMRVMFHFNILHLLKKYLFLAAWIFIAAHVLSLVVEARPLIVMASPVAEEPNSGL